MSIASVDQRGLVVYVRDERGALLFTKSVGTGRQDGVVGYTAQYVTIRNGNVLTVYGQRGQFVSSRPA